MNSFMIEIGHKWLRSSMVERATHNRLVTGSNPVGANILFKQLKYLPIFLLLTVGSAAIAQQPSSSTSNPLPGIGATGSGAATATNASPSGADSSTPALRPALSKDGQSLTPDANATSGSGATAAPMWPANDTLPLGVDQFTNPVKLPDLKGPVGKFVQLVSSFTANKPCINCIGVQVKIQNQSSSPLILDGEHAQAISSSNTVKALTDEKAFASSGGTFTKKQKEKLLAVALVTGGLLEPVLQDHFSTSKTDFPVCYGPNETRRRFEDRRMAKRIVLPGEDTEGIIYFPGTTIQFDKISIPILTYPASQSAGTLDILGGPATAQAAPPMVNSSLQIQSKSKTNKKATVQTQTANPPPKPILPRLKHKES